MDARDIAGYDYKGEQFRPGMMINRLIADGSADALIKDGRVPTLSAEEMLDVLASAQGIDRNHLHSYDSGEFPKPIDLDQITDADDHWYKP